MNGRGQRQVLWRDVFLHPMLARIGRGPVLLRTEFIGCRVVGPAVVVARDCVFEDCNTLDPVDEVWWPAPPAGDSEVPPGAVGLRHCTFRDCTFDGIGFVTVAGRPPLTLAERSAAQDAPTAADRRREAAR